MKTAMAAKRKGDGMASRSLEDRVCGWMFAGREDEEHRLVRGQRVYERAPQPLPTTYDCNCSRTSCVDTLSRSYVS